jgi:holo-[acyl-carrier protein] synthase
MIVNVGADLVSIPRVQRLVEAQGARFLHRLFTAEERAYCDAKNAPAQHLAARMAAKEAVMKVLHAGPADGVGWKDVEITHAKDGAPGVVLHRRARELASEAGVARVHLSLSHEVLIAA